MISEDIKELSDFLLISSARDANFHPIDRFYLEPFLDQILKFNRNDFLLYNFSLNNITYTSYLMLCLPELWEDIHFEDISNVLDRLRSDYSFFPFIYFTYKFIEIDSIKLVLNLKNINVEWRNEILSFVKNQYMNFIKEEVDYEFFDSGIIGVTNEDWMKIKRRLLMDKRIEPALATVLQLKEYVSNI